MSLEAATPTGGAPVSARSDASATPSVHDRLKAHLNQDSPPPARPEPAATETDSNAPLPRENAEAETEDKPEVEAEVTTDDAQTEAEPAELSTLDELAEALADQGYGLDRLLDLEAKVKIDGKESKAKLRDLIKSHQLEGHLNQKLMTFADEKKAFEVERQTKHREMADKHLRLDAGLQTLERALANEFATVDWQSLQTENPAEFNAKYVGYQHRYAELQAIGQQIAQEQKQAQSEAAAQQSAYLDEQRKLLQAKVPEWSDKARRMKDLDEHIAPVLSKTYGYSKDELVAISDHRTAMAMRDLAKFLNAKPAVINKVKAAPKLLKPGTTQSRAALNNLQLSKDRDRLRSTGKVRDAARILKQFM